MYRQARYDEPLLAEMDGRRTLRLPNEDLEAPPIPEGLARRELRIPDLEEWRVVRHFTRLSHMNYGVDVNTYPLGSCTMKYNPKVAEIIGTMHEATMLHPYQDERTVQGALRVMYELQEYIKALTGMDAVTLQPAAGAHGEFTGMLMARAYFEDRGEERDEVIVPDSAHGTNPASAAMAGFKVVEIPSLDDGTVDLRALESALSERTAAFMITNPNTLGIFEDKILEIAEMVHDHGALLYYDGANLNAIMGITTPGAMNFDIVHVNLHKTFSTPHGGGGPGAGPVGVKSHLRDFLPVPVVAKDGDRYYFDYSIPKTIGKVRAFYGNFLVLLRAWAYIRLMGGDGLREAAIRAVTNANYLKEKLKGHYPMPGKDLRKHEFVLSGKEMKEKYGVRTLDVAKRLLDYGYHAPTVYFPLIVDEAIMVEPTETESKEELDSFAEALIRIKREAEEDPELLKTAPRNTAVERVDDVRAARKPLLTWKDMGL